MTFEVIDRFNTEFNGIPITQFKSSLSGLSLVHVETEGPLVNGFFALATEALDDDGCPHTLEHLVFLGSEDYPYKGVLDSLANRAFARGTNAWTDIDHTCYTLTTAGSSGFLDMLPIFLDHILYPTLTHSGYYTEVHHVTANGDNAGVVYSEMQGRENTGPDRMQLELQRCLFGSTGYASETGGLMLNLRSLSVDKIRAYHSSFYRPNNLCVVIVGGGIDQKDLLKRMEMFDEKIKSKGPLPPMKKPWVDSTAPAPLLQSITKEVEFPDEDESVGNVYVAWRGPLFHDYLEQTKLFVLADYLTDSVISLLQKEFVETEDSYATSVSFSFLQYLETAHLLDFDGVPIDHIDEIHSKLMKILHDHVRAGVDMERIRLVLEKIALKQKGDVETDPAEFFVKPCIYDFMYAKDKGELRKSIAYMSQIETLKSLKAEDWTLLIKKWFLERPSVTIIGRPSATLAKQLHKDEEARVEKQKLELGKEKLENLGKALEKAKNDNEREIPAEIFEKVMIPCTDSILLLPIETSSTTSVEDSPLRRHLLGDSSKVPFFIQFDHIKSEFVELNVYIDTQNMADDLRPFLELYLDTFFVLPLEIDGKVVPHEKVVQSLEEDTVEYGNSVGCSSQNFTVGSFGQMIIINLKMERRKYEKGITWLKNLLFYSVFDPLRLVISATKLLNDIPNHKREGMLMSQAALKGNIFHPTKSNHAACHILKQEQFLEEILEKLESDSDEEDMEDDEESTVDNDVIEMLLRLRSFILNPENFRVHVAGNILEIKKPVSPWTLIFGAIEYRPSPDIQYANQLLNDLGRNPSKKIYMVIMPAIESAFVTHITKGPSSFNHPEVPALRVLNEYLTTMEGPFWKEVRGTGLAYGANLRLDLESGLIYFTIYRSPEPFKAFLVVKEILGDLADGKLSFETKYVEAAKSSIVYSLVSSQETPISAASESFLNRVLRKVGPDYSKQMMRRVQDVTIEEMKIVLNKYLKQLFDPSTSCGAIAASPNKVDNRFQSELGFEIEHVTIQDMYNSDDIE